MKILKVEMRRICNRHYKSSNRCMTTARTKFFGLPEPKSGLTNPYEMIPENSREMQNSQEFSRFPRKSWEILRSFCATENSENSWEFLGTPPAVFYTFSRILENSQDLTEMCENLRF